MVKKILVFVGKPFYFLLSRIFIFFVFISYLTSRLLKSAPTLLIRINRVFKTKKKKSKFLQVPLNSSKVKLRELNFRLKPILPIFLVLLLTFTFYLLILRDLPSPKALGTRIPQLSTKIYDRNGNLLYKIYKDQNRTIVPLAQIPTSVRLATLAAEDAEFYTNPGFSIKGIFRAIIQNTQTGSLQGGSTITQQLVKNTLLTPEKTLSRKIKEIILSIEVEANYTKDQILEMYLNEVSYGGTAYGIEEAAQSYFGKKVNDLDLSEAALLAGLPKSPTTYSPFGTNPDLAIQRQREVLRLMLINKFITTDQETSAKNEELNFVSSKTQIKAPHFVMYVRQILVDKYGEDMVEKGGLEVTTSLDLTIQENAEKIVKTEVDKLKNLHVGNGAALVTNPQTGEILSMVGSKDYFDVNADGNVNVIAAQRQPGSSIKVVNYAYALSNKYTPATIIDDSKITYVTPGTTPYTPVNYDGQFKGPITLRSALAQSRNIPAVKILASYGVTKMIEQGKKMGILSWKDPINYGLSLTLGGGSVTALDLSKVYSTIANGGTRPDLTPILEVKDYKGRILLARNNSQSDLGGEKILDSRVAFLITNILKDNNARAPEFGYNSYLVIKNHPEVAVKTGTSNDLRDNWTVGYTQDYLVLTWVGNNDNSPMSHVASGVTGASPIWNKIMSMILTDKQSIDWKVPDGVVRINCPDKSEWFLKENILPHYCQPTPTPSPIPTGQNILDNGASTTR